MNREPRFVAEILYINYFFFSRMNPIKRNYLRLPAYKETTILSLFFCLENFLIKFYLRKWESKLKKGYSWIPAGIIRLPLKMDGMFYSNKKQRVFCFLSLNLDFVVGSFYFWGFFFLFDSIIIIESRSFWPN